MRTFPPKAPVQNTYSVDRKKRFAALCVSSALAFTLAGTALAGTRSYSNLNSQSATDIVIRAPGESAQSRKIVVPFSKATTIEFPTEMHEVIVSNPEVVDAILNTSHRALIVGKRPGQTNAIFLGRDGQELLTLEIRVERDISGLRDLIREHAPKANVEVQAVNDNILLTGSVPNASAARGVQSLAQMWLDEATPGDAEGEVVSLVSIEGKDQVLLKVRIVEMQRSVTKQMGVNLNAVARLGESTVSLLSSNGLTPGSGLDASGTFNNVAGGALSELGFGLQALERVGLVRTLAEPTLTAISGETANFLSGGEFPLLTNVFIDENGRLQREFEFKPYGVSLGFTPTVLSEGRINLNISTEVSEPTTEGSFETGGIGSDILGLRVRRANTVVELPAGGSLVIAGLIREEARQSIDGTPGMKDIPGIGAAFRSRDDLTSQSELVIIVTPYLVDPVHPDKLQTPLDGFVAASDNDALLLGRLNKVYNGKAGKKITSDSLPGPFGHVVD